VHGAGAPRDVNPAQRHGEGARTDGAARQADPTGPTRALEALHALALAAAEGHEVATLAQLAVDQVRDLLGVDAASLYWWDPDAALLRWLAHTDPGDVARPLAARPGEGAALAGARVLPVR
jgi:hypothetical protein